jgi:hypothetical protein
MKTTSWLCLVLVSFDLRGNYSIFEPRADEHTRRLNSNLTLYDIAGALRDIFVQFNIGIARYIDKRMLTVKKKTIIKDRPRTGNKRRSRD